MEEELSAFAAKNILVIGDTILDITIEAEAVGLSLESPTLKAVQKDKLVSFGGAFNVVKNIISLGARCTFVTLVGKDEYQSHIEGFRHPNLNFISLYEEEYNNVVKSRFWARRGDHKYKVFQLNSGNKLSGELKGNNIETMKRLLEKEGAFDRVLLVDYRNGLLTEGAVGMIKDTATAPIIASSQMSDGSPNYKMYDGAGLICMNEREYAANKNHLFQSSLCITQGERGSSLYMEGAVYDVPTIKVGVRDSCGAGDCFLAALSVHDYEKYPEEALFASNVYAAMSVTRIGTQLPDFKEYNEYIRKNSRNK